MHINAYLLEDQCTWMQMPAEVRGIGCSWSWSICEWLVIGAGNGTWVLCPEQYVLLPSQPSLQPGRPFLVFSNAHDQLKAAYSADINDDPLSSGVIFALVKCRRMSGT